MAETCRTCRYWKRDGGANPGSVWGECRRYPPARSERDPTVPLAALGPWPRCPEGDWCGEYARIHPEEAA